MTIYPVSALRAVALRTQALHMANGSEPTPMPDSLFQVVNQIGCVQIDTLQMVRRSHYLVAWSRLGTYEPHDFDALIFRAAPPFLRGLGACCFDHPVGRIPLSDASPAQPARTSHQLV